MCSVLTHAHTHTAEIQVADRRVGVPLTTSHLTGHCSYNVLHGQTCTVWFAANVCTACLLPRCWPVVLQTTSKGDVDRVMEMCVAQMRHVLDAMASRVDQAVRQHCAPLLTLAGRLQSLVDWSNRLRRMLAEVSINAQAAG